MAIITAILALVGTAVGAGVKADQKNKEAYAQQQQLQQQRELLRGQKLSDVLNFITADKTQEATTVRWILIAAMVAMILLIWFAIRNRK